MGNASSAQQQEGAPPAIRSKHFPAALEATPSMAGKRIAITGCTSGTGLVLALAMASKGANVVMLNRPSSRAEAALQQVQEAAADATLITHVDCDLSTFKSTRAAAEQLLAAGNPIDVLVNNAGVMAMPDTATEDGYDLQMQVNHLSHFLLTSLVWPLLQQAAATNGEARVVNHSSMARLRTKVDLAYYGRNGGQLGGDKTGFLMSGPRWKRYSQTKLANIGFTLALHDRIAALGPDSPSTNIKVLCAHPGFAATQLAITTANNGGIPGGMMKGMTKMLAQSSEDGTLGILLCTCNDIPSGNLVGPTGMKGKAVVMKPEPEQKRVPPADRDALWKASCEATGIESFFPQ